MQLAIVRALGSKCGSRKNSVKPSECIFFISPQTRIAPRKIGFGYDEWMSGQTIYAYVGGNPISYTDPKGLAVPVAVAACMANPLCAASAAAAATATAKACLNTAKAFRHWYDQRQTPDQEALGDLVRDVSKGGRIPVSDKDADTLLDWGREVGSNVRDDRKTDHWKGGPHIHIPGSGVGHIPVK